MLVLDLGGGPLDRLGQGLRLLGLVLAGALGVVEPVAQFAFLGAGEAPDLAAVVGVALDQGEGVRRGVVSTWAATSARSWARMRISRSSERSWVIRTR
ncbi:hypothetical protein SCALM49S_00884 [Streptomyces californicus]